MPKRKIQLIFPLSYEHYYMPEIALPRLTAHLRKLGHDVRQSDFNAEYYGDFLFRDRIFSLFVNHLAATYRITNDCFYGPVKKLYDDYLQRENINVEELKQFLFENRKELFNWLYEIRYLEDASVEAVRANSRRKDMLPDLYLRWRLSLLATGPAPDIVGISIISPQQLVLTIRMARMLRQIWPESLIVAGGPWVKLARDFIAKPEYDSIFSWFDVLSLADGEQPLADLADRLDEPKSWEAIPNIAYADRMGKVFVTKKARTPAITELPAPDFDDLNWKLYAEAMLPVERASMCYYRRCTFCWHNYSDREWALLEPEVVADRVQGYVERSHIRSFSMIDNAVDETYSRKLSELIIQRGLEIEWVMQARLNKDFTDRNYTDLLAQSGCKMIFFGLEAADRDLLKRYKKGINLLHVPRALKNCAASGISVALYLMVYPDQTKEQFENTLRFCLSQKSSVFMAVIQEFLLNTNCLAYHKPDLLGIEPSINEKGNLDFFNRAYEKEGILIERDYLSRSGEQFRRLMRYHGDLGPLDGFTLDEIYQRIFDRSE
jgi:hypothetical protein